MRFLPLFLGLAASLHPMAGPPVPPAPSPGPDASLPAHDLAYAPGALDNPLKGLLAFLPSDGPDKRSYPCSMAWGYFPLKALMLDWDRYDWAPMEAMLNQAAAEGRQSVVRVYLEYPDKESGIPDFLRKSGIAIRHTKQWNTESPDYDDPRTLKALTNFIRAWAAKYDGDPRLGFITLGLVGLWGEWHLWPSQELFPKDDSVAQVIDAFDQSFKKTKLLIRYPQVGSGYAVKKNIGFHDDSFAFKEPSGDLRKSGSLPASLGGWDWSFLQHVLDQGAENRWIDVPMGGEVRPEIQTTLFSDKVQVDDLKTCVELSHVSWLIDHKGVESFHAGDPRMDAFVRSLGYDLWIPRAYFKNDLKPGEALRVGVSLVNDGVARFYYPWRVLLAARDSSGRIVKQWGTPWDISQVQPRKIRAYPDWKSTATDPQLAFAGPRFESTVIAQPGLGSGTYQLLLRVVNPLEAQSRLARPLRFSNATQEPDGWLGLGSFSVAGDQ
jgi:hypothetical protein